MKYIAIALLLIGVVVQAQPAADQTKIAPGFVSKSKRTLIGNLKDPDSAKLRGLYVANSRPLGETRSIVPVLCGEVNARNSYGGYSGFKRFYAAPGIVGIDSEDEVFNAMHFSFCTDKIADVK